MAAILLVVCLASAQDQCEEKSLPIEQPMDVMGCLRYGQAYAAQWAAQHPEYVIKQWRCSASRG